MQIYLNGKYLDYSQALLPVDERGLQFADGIYEVVLIWGGQFVDMDRHPSASSAPREASNSTCP